MEIECNLFDSVDLEKSLFSLYDDKEDIFGKHIELDITDIKTKKILITLCLNEGKLVDINFDNSFIYEDLSVELLNKNLLAILDLSKENILEYFLNFLIYEMENKIKMIEHNEFQYKSDKDPKKLAYIKQLFLIVIDYKNLKQLNEFLLLSKSNLDISYLIAESEINITEFVKYNKEYSRKFINNIIYCYINYETISNFEQIVKIYNNLDIELKCHFVNTFLEQSIKHNKSFVLIKNIANDFQNIVKYNGLNILKILVDYFVNLDDKITIGNIYKELYGIEIIIDEKIFNAQDLFIYNLFQDRLLSNNSISKIFELIKYTNIKDQENFLKIINNFNINNENTEKFINDFLKRLSIYYLKNPSKENKSFVEYVCKYFFGNGIFLKYKTSNQKIKAKDFLVYNIIDNIFETRNFTTDIFKLFNNIIINDEELENIVINSLFIYNSCEIFYNFIIYLTENNSIKSKNFIKNIYNKTNDIFFNFYGNNQIKVSHYIVNVILNSAVTNREKDIFNILQNILSNKDDFAEIINFNKDNDILYLNNPNQLCIFENLTRLYNTKENNNFIEYIIRKIDNFEILEKFKNFNEEGKFFYNIINYRLEELKEMEKLKEIVFINEGINFTNFKELYDKEPNNFILNFFNIINTQNIQKNEYDYLYSIIVNLEKSINNKNAFLEKFKHNEDFSIFYLNKKLEKENIFIKQENDNYFIINENDNIVIKLENGNKNIIDYITYEQGSNYLETEYLKLINEKTGIKRATIKNYEKHKIFNF